MQHEPWATEAARVVGVPAVNALSPAGRSTRKSSKRAALNTPHAAAMPARQSLLSLRDGRALAYLQLGPPASSSGAPALIYHHGWPSSAAEAEAVCGAAAGRLGLHVIAFDRPGVGGSSWHPCAHAAGADGLRAPAACC